METRPQCVIYSIILANDDLELAKLECHLKTIHPNICDHPPEFFEGKFINLKKMKFGHSRTHYALPEKILTGSF